MTARATEGKWPVSSGGGGALPIWSRSGDRITFLRGSALMEAEVRTSPSVAVGTPRQLFDGEASGIVLRLG